METTSERHWRPFLLALAFAALVATVTDVAMRTWWPAASSAFLMIGVLAFWRSLHFHSVRWRALAGISLVLAIVVHLARFAMS